jgi:hypothetical protein
VTVRIETGSPEQVLPELPPGLVHTCITVPPEDELDAVKVLYDVRRVLREDGTVWLLQKRSEHFIPDLLAALGWHEHPTPGPILRLARDCSREVLLLTKTSQPRIVLPARPRARQRACDPRPTRKRERGSGCARVARLELIRACLQAASTATVCLACGAPPDHAGRLRCGHSRAEGRPLVLDPFYRPSSLIAQVALAYGRSFLGITNPIRERSA